MNKTKSKEKEDSIEYIEFIVGGKELLHLVGPLWEKLNKHHLEKSIHFKEKYKSFTFETRKKVFHKKDNNLLYVTLAKDNKLKKYIGYIIASVTEDGIGEIESIYVESDYRGFHIGDKFMEESIKWIKANGGYKIIIGVAGGNEEALKFYERYGFYTKSTILEQV